MTKIANEAKQNADKLSKEDFNKDSPLINIIDDRFSPESIHADFCPVRPEAIKHINQGAGMLEASKLLKGYCTETDEDTEFPGMTLATR